MAAAESDDALVQIQELCSALRLTSQQLDTAAGELDAGEQGDVPGDASGETLAEAIDAAGRAAEASDEALDGAAAALSQCAGAAGRAGGEQLARWHAEFQAAARAAAEEAARWRAHVEETASELGSAGFEPLAELLDPVDEAAQRAGDAVRAAGDALEESRGAAEQRLRDVQSEAATRLQAAGAAASRVVDALLTADWPGRWTAAYEALAEASESIADEVEARFHGWLAAVEAALTAQEGAVLAAAQGVAEELEALGQALESTVEAWSDQRGELRAEMLALDAAAAEEAAYAGEWTALARELAIGLRVAAIVEATLRALKE